MPKVFAHIFMCGVRRDILFEGENPLYIIKWRTLLWSDYNLHSLFSSKDRERKDECCALVIDAHDFLV